MVFRCMIHNLFDEYQFFHNYPDKARGLGGSLLLIFGISASASVPIKGHRIMCSRVTTCVWMQ